MKILKNKIVKTVTASILFLSLVVTGSLFFIMYYLNSEAKDCEDINLRNSLAGNLDILVVGSCQGKYAFVPSVIDDKLDACSYNLSGIHMSHAGEYAMLEEELCRNPVELVVIDIDYDVLSYTTKGVKALGEITLIPRLAGGRKKIEYFFRNVHIEDYKVLYSSYMSYGLTAFIGNLVGTYESAVDSEAKGYYSRECNDQTIPDDKCSQFKNSNQLCTEILENNNEKVAALIELCRSYGTDVVMCMTPASDSFVWEYNGLDEIYANVSAIADEYDVDYFDFNLLKNKSEILNDAESYEGKAHLSDTGSKIFTEEFCEILKKRENGENIKDLFYGSYEEAKENSPYAKVAE